MCQDLNHLTHFQVKINPHNPPFNLDLGIPHTPPYNLGLSPDFTNELPGVCIPYQVLQPYTILHANNLYSIKYFSYASWWFYHHHSLLHPLAFPYSSSPLTLLLHKSMWVLSSTNKLHDHLLTPTTIIIQIVLGLSYVHACPKITSYH